MKNNIVINFDFFDFNENIYFPYRLSNTNKYLSFTA